MSGHSKWSTIKRKKGVMDARRGALFSKLIREITTAAKEGGDDLGSNPRLRTVVTKAKEINMPGESIEKAIKRGSTGMGGGSYEEARYEGYGPGGVAVMIDCLTDNRNRTSAEIKNLFTKNGGRLGETGSVSYLFYRKGMIIVEAGQITEDEAIELLIDHGIENIKAEDGNISIVMPPEVYNDVYTIIKEKGLKINFNDITYFPTSTTKLAKDKAIQCLNLIVQFEKNDDVQHVYSNYDIPEDIMRQFSEEQ